MPYRDIEKRREAVRQSRLKAEIPETPVVSGGCEIPDETPEILLALTDPAKRAKLQAICDGLEKNDLLQAVYRGAGEHMFRADKLLDMLKATA